MKAFFSCTTNGIDKHKDEYLAIRDIILSLGHELTRDWLDVSLQYAEAKIEDVPSSTVYEKVIAAILAADVVIFESTVRSMSIGHQLSIALEHNKSVLLLTKNLQTRDKKHFIIGKESPFLTVKNYKNKNELPAIIGNYLKSIDTRTKYRFNLVIDKKHDNYLRWANFTYKHNKTEIIKSALDKTIDEDTQYLKFVESQN